ncbi:MazG nucleotide pyrophosphohydrolase domain-containing protein [Streptosporangium canum]|uniref:MazG nucleotide pyrophosphohydrolase domain-containing protein n=1 Tax=Streptosporangium canum TaxID=324952 RepID=UPI003679DBA3
MEQARNLSDSSLIEQCLKLAEETGEVCKAVRKHEALSIDPASSVGHVGHELADVLIYVAAIANRADIDLTDTLRIEQNGDALLEDSTPRTHSPSLAGLQRHVDTTGQLFSFTLIEQCLKLEGKIGKICTTVLARQVAATDSTGTADSLGQALTGALICLVAIANRADIDLTNALRTKEEINNGRVWTKPTMMSVPR